MDDRLGWMSLSFENDRAVRMDKIMELLRANPQGLTLQTIARETSVLQQITRDRLIKYVEELEWAGVVHRLKDGRIKLK